jgi:hypothetical protein
VYPGPKQLAQVTYLPEQKLELPAEPWRGMSRLLGVIPMVKALSLVCKVDFWYCFSPETTVTAAKARRREDPAKRIVAVEWGSKEKALL